MKYTPSDVSGKQRIVKSEAPSVKVFVTDNTPSIIGMMAENVQLLVSIYTLEESQDFLVFLDNALEDEKLNFYVISKESFETIENFTCKNQFKKIQIAQDSKGDFAKKFGVGLEAEGFENNLAYGAFVIDKEGEFKYVSYFLKPSEKESSILVEKTKESINFKLKGHVHENWMGA